jgi:hypothetical protein
MADDTIERGIYVPPEAKAQLAALLACFDPKGSLDRIDGFAKWIFASSAIVGALGAGLSNAGLSKVHGMGLFLLGLSILSLGISLAYACKGIAPNIVDVDLNQFESMRMAVNRQIVQRQKSVSIAAGLYCVAILLAALVPISSLACQSQMVRVSYVVDAKGLVSADVAVSGAKRFAQVELGIARQGVVLATVAVTVDQSGEANLHLAPVPLDIGGSSDLTVKEELANETTWKELRKIVIRR